MEIDPDLRFQSEAVEALQEAAEAYLVGLFQQHQKSIDEIIEANKDDNNESESETITPEEPNETVVLYMI